MPSSTTPMPSPGNCASSIKCGSLATNSLLGCRIAFVGPEASAHAGREITDAAPAPALTCKNSRLCINDMALPYSRVPLRRTKLGEVIRGGWPGFLISPARSIQRVPRPSRSLRRAGITNAYATRFLRSEQNVVTAASLPALAKNARTGHPQRRGSHEHHRSWVTRRHPAHCAQNPPGSNL